MNPNIFRETRRRYKDDYNDPRWIDFSLSLKEKVGMCEYCCSKDSLHVHHCIYIPGRRAWEYSWEDKEVKVLCSLCHQNVTEVCDRIWMNCLPLEPEDGRLLLKLVELIKRDWSGKSTVLAIRAAEESTTQFGANRQTRIYLEHFYPGLRRFWEHAI